MPDPRPVSLCIACTRRFVSGAWRFALGFGEASFVALPFAFAAQLPVAAGWR